MSKFSFVGVGHKGTCLTSENGNDWKQTHEGRDGEILRAVCFGGGRCVAVGAYGGENIFAVSTDGTRWKTEKKDAGYVRFVRTVCFSGGLFFGYGGDGTSVGSANPFQIHSEDGLKWSDYKEIGGANLIRRVAFGKGKFVGVGDRGRVSLSPNGQDNWRDVPNTKALDTFADVAFGNGVFVGVGLNGLRMKTKDGQNWTHSQRGEEGEHLNSIVFTGKQFVAVGSGVTYFSPDGEQWKREPNHNAPQTATFGNEIYVGTRWRGRLLLSENALDWKEGFKCTQPINAVASGQWG